MADLSKEYKQVIENLAANIKNKEDLEYILSQIDILIKAFTRRNGEYTKFSKQCYE